MTTRNVTPLVLAAFLTPWLVAAGEPRLDISLEPEIRCWAMGEHSTVLASVDPLAPTARVYFRCSLYQDYYFVNLERDGNRYTAVLPQASAECPSVYYYVEAVSADFASSRTRERVADVSEAAECRRVDPLVALFTGDPRIIIGATSVLSPEMAPGFSLAGVAGFVSAAGATSGGGGLGTAAIAGIGGAGAAGVVAVVSGGESTSGGDVAGEIAPTLSSDPAPSPEAAAPAPSDPAGPADTAPIACVTTEPKPAVIAAGESIRFDASCSTPDSGGDSGDRIADYVWDISDGRQKTGRVVRTVFREPGVYQVTLTVVDGGTSFVPQRDSTTFDVTVEDHVEACFTASDFDPGSGCRVSVDATCSRGDIEHYEWVWFDGFNSYFFTDRRFVKDWGSCPLSTTLTLTVTTSTGKSDAITKSVNVSFQKTVSEPPRLDLVALVERDADREPNASTRLLVSDTATVELPRTGARRVHVIGRAGVQRISVEPAGGFDPSARLTLDFASTKGLVPGSLRVRDGDIVAVGPSVVVLRLSRRASVEYELR